MKCPKCQFDNPADTNYCGKCASPLSPSQSIRPELTETIRTPVHELTTGSTFAGRYQIIEELGHGGMGKVFKIFDTDVKENEVDPMLCSKCGGRMKVVAFLTEHAVVDRIIDHLELTFVADRPPPSRVLEQVALLVAEESGEYF